MNLKLAYSTIVANRDALYLTLLLCVTSFWLFAEQNLLAPSLSLVAAEFGFNEKDKDLKLGGEVSVGFFIVGGLCGLVVGHMTDTATRWISRTNLFALVVLVGESGCFGTYMCSTYNELLICRIITGVAVGGASPILYSLLGDIWGASSRVYVATAIGMAMSFGAAFGQVLAAYLAPKYGWRQPFLAVVLPAIKCVILLFYAKDPLLINKSGSGSDMVLGDQEAGIGMGNDEYIEENNSLMPLRNTGASAILNRNKGMHSPHHSKTKTNTNTTATVIATTETVIETVTVFSKCKDIFGMRTACYVFLQGIFGCIPWSILGVYFNDFLQHDLHMTVNTSTILMTMFGIGAAIGQVGGGWLGQQLFNRDPRKQTILMGVTTILGTFPLLLVINSDAFAPHLAATAASANANAIGASSGDTPNKLVIENPDNQHLFYGNKNGTINLVLNSYAAPAHEPEAYIYFLFIVTGILAAITGPNVKSVLQNITTTGNRGLAFAIYVMADDVGKGAGPYFVAKLINWTGNRKEAFDIGICCWLLSGSFLLLMHWSILIDSKNKNKAEDEDDDDDDVMFGPERGRGRGGVKSLQYE